MGKPDWWPLTTRPTCLKARDVMRTKPRTIHMEALAAEAAEMMEQCRITSILVVDDNGCLCGAINTNDLMRAKVI